MADEKGTRLEIKRVGASNVRQIMAQNLDFTPIHQWSLERLKNGSDLIGFPLFYCEFYF